MSYQKFGSASPYFDDYNQSHNFLRILFNPSRAVQARELTQLQTILQTQIQQIGSNLYQDNTPISGAQISISANKPTCTVSQFELIYDNVNNDWAQDGVTVLTVDASWIGKVFQNVDPTHGNLTPSQTMTITGYDLIPGQNPVLYYEFSGQNVVNAQQMYDSGNQGAPVGGMVIAADPFQSLVASCSQGVIWSRGFFVDISPQNVVVSNTPNVGQFNIGFVLAENVVTSQDAVLGTSLLDPANGSYNYNAPGADRYQITATLSFYDVSTVGTLDPEFLNNFVPFAYVVNGAIVSGNNGTQYGPIIDLLAHRTYDANGNFITNNFNLVLKEAASTLVPFAGDTTVNLSQYSGYVLGDDDINDYLVAQISPGKAYVQGYEIQKYITSNVLVRKGRDTEVISNDVLNLVSPFYVVANLATQSSIASVQPDGAGTIVSTVGNWLKFSQMERVQIMSGTDGQGRILSEGRIQAVDRQGDLLRIFLIETNVAPITAVSFVAGTNYAANAFVFVLGGALTGEIYRSNNAVTSAINPANDPINWDYITDSDYPNTAAVIDTIKFNNFAQARSVRSLGAPGTYVNLALNAAGTSASPLFGSASAPLIYGIPNIAVPNSLSPTIVQNMVGTYSLVLNSSSQASVTSTASSTTFASQNQNGLIYAYVAQSSVSGLTNQLIDISQISLGVSGNSALMDFSSVVINGSSLASGDKITVALKENHAQSQARTKTKSVGTTTIVVGNPNTDIVMLSQCDCTGIQGIVQVDNNADGTSNRALTAKEMLNLRFDNGQRDSYYDFGSVSNFSSLWTSNKASVKSGSSYVPTTYVITYTYYDHENNPDKIFFALSSYSDINSADSYDQVLPYRSRAFGAVDVLMSLDFRRKVTELENSSNVLKWALPFDEVIIPSVTHYVGRYMLISMDKNGNFVVTQGLPSVGPSIPASPQNNMLMWTLGVPPYTFDRKQVSIAMSNNNVYRMSDIYNLDQRIKNLESYVSLNALESAAARQQIIDPSTGMQAYQSGIFTDNFLTTSAANTQDPMYRVSSDSRGPNLATPVQFWNMSLDVIAPASTAQIGPNLILLPMTSQLSLCQNLLATETVNLNPYTFYVWRANVSIDPAIDTWYETQALPEQTVTVGSFNPPPGYNPTPQINTVQTNWVGYVRVPASQTVTPATVQAPVAKSASQTTGTTSSQLNFGNLSSPGQVTALRRAGFDPNDFAWSSPRSQRVGRVTVSENTAVPAQNLPNIQSLALAAGTNSSGTSASTVPLNILQSYQVSADASAGNVAVNVTSATTTTTTQSLVTNQTSSASTRVVDTTLLPYMRPRTVQFIASGMRPGMKVQGLLDGNPVTIVPDEKYLTKNGTYVTDASGNISGVFLIPDNTFTAGTKQFTIVDETNTSAASAMYTSQGNLTQTQNTITTIRSVEVVTSSSTQTSQVTNGLVQTPTASKVPGVVAQPVAVVGTNPTVPPAAPPAGVPAPLPAPPAPHGFGSGGCVVVDAHILDAASLSYRAGDALVGDELMLAHENTLSPSVGSITYSNAMYQPCVEIITKSGISLKCSYSAPIPVEDQDGCLFAPKVMGHKVAIRHLDGTVDWDEVTAVNDIGGQLVQHISIEQQCFWATSGGKGYILHHNKRAPAGMANEGIVMKYADPLAQSFQVTQPNGIFLSSMTLYFATKSGDFENTTRQINGQPIANVLAGLYGSEYPKDIEGSNSIYQNTFEPTGIPMQLYLVSMSNGTPTQNIVPLSRVVVYPNQVNSHPLIPSQAATTITFPDPVYLEGGNEYALVMASSSKEYNVWTSTLGKLDIFAGGASAPGAGIAEQPFLGQFFESKNSSTWVPEPLTVLTFSMNYAQFQLSAQVTLEDDKVIDDNSFANGSTNPWNALTVYNPGDIVYFNYLVSGVTVGNFFEVGGSVAAAKGAKPASVSGTTVVVNSPWVQLSNGAYSGNLLSKRYLSNIIPIIGEMLPNGTSVAHSHLFYQGTSIPGGITYVPCTNLDDNDVTAMGPVTGSEKQIDNNGSLRQNYRIQTSMATTDANVSPVIDLQQLRAIGTRNLVLGVNPDLLYGGLSNSVLLNDVNTNGIAHAKALGQVSIGVAYVPNSIVYYPASPTTYYQYVGTSSLTYATGGGDIEIQFFNGVTSGVWARIQGYTPPFVDNQPMIGDGGTYISETVTLAQQADNVTLTLDWMKRGSSYINVYYRTTTDDVQSVYTRPYDDSEGVNVGFAQGQNMKIFYRGAISNATALSNQIPGGGTRGPLCTVSGSTNVDGNRAQVYLSAISELGAFAEGLTYDSLGVINGSQLYSISNSNFVNVNSILLVPQSETALDSLGSLTDWNPATSYNLGDIVCTENATGEIKNFRIWEAAAFIAALWSNTTAYTINQVVVISSGPGKPFLAYKAVAGNTGANPTSDNGSNWVLQYASAGTPAPAYGLGTVPTQLGTAWNEVPSISIASAIASESSNDWKPMVLQTAVNGAALVDNTYYELTYVPQVAPPSAFNNFAVRVDMRTAGNDRINVTKVKNLRVIASF